jgi:hypothetical protein
MTETITKQRTLNYLNLHGFKAYVDASRGIAPYFQNTLQYRVNKKLSTNIAITGEPGIGKSYLTSDICRVHEGLDNKHEERFELEQVCYFFGDYMDLTLKLGIGKPIMFDEPSYAMGKRDWYKELNKVLVSTMESSRFKVHPTFIPIINLSLLDKTIRQHLIQYQIVMHDRGYGTAYRVQPSQFTEKVYYSYLCDLRYKLLDMNLCAKDSCLGCPSLDTCNIFRARYERKKASIQDTRYEQAKEQAQQSETRHLTIKQLENLSLAVKDKFMERGKLNVQRLRIALSDEYGIHLSQSKSYELKESLEVHHKDKLVEES